MHRLSLAPVANLLLRFARAVLLACAALVVQALPAQLKTNLPSIDQIEAELTEPATAASTTPKKAAKKATKKATKKPSKKPSKKAAKKAAKKPTTTPTKKVKP